MLPSRLYKAVLNAGVRRLSVCSSPRLKRPFAIQCLKKTRNTLLPLTNNCLTSCRQYSDDGQVLLPPLVEDRLLVYPNIFKMINGALQIFLIIPRFDRDFKMDEFLEGSKQAVSTVSKALAAQDYDSLQGLVTNDVINSLRNKISTLSDEQKQVIALEVDDIYVQFPYEVGIIFNDDKADQKSLEITVVYYALRGLKYMKDEFSDQNPMFVGSNPAFRKRCFICNYRFIRSYPETEDSSWTINYINHFSSDSQ